MLRTIMIGIAATFIFFIHVSNCVEDSPFVLYNKESGLCLMGTPAGCPALRWTTGSRLFSLLNKKCLGVQGKTVGSTISFYDCDENSELQKWQCKNETGIALKDQELYIKMQDASTAVLSSQFGPSNNFLIQGTSDGACSRRHRELYTIGGNAFGQVCMFPFFYKDQWFADCTTADRDRLWCAVETKYENQLWGYCPTNSTLGWDQHHVTGEFYQINVESTLTARQAAISCNQQGASLLTITDPNQQAYVTALLSKRNNRFWIGLVRSNAGNWIWQNGLPFRYQRWDSGYPQRGEGILFCTVIESEAQYYWRNTVCSHKLGYICYKNTAPAPPVQVETGFCSSPWVPYNGHCFHIFREKKTWSDALSQCRKEGGDLASIHNTEENSFLITQLGYASSDELWIGLNDRKTESLFDWSDQSDVTFIPWEQWRPSTYSQREQQDCVLIRGVLGGWADLPCDNKRGFICMKKSVSQPSGDEVDVDIGCRPGWKRHGSYCYLVGPTTKTFDEAKAECKNLNSYLADVSNGVDNAFLVSLVGLRTERYFWIGLSNQNNRDEFEWTNTNRVTFTHWNSEMPGRHQGCVAMTTGVFAGLWDVLTCTNSEKYICKHLADGAVPTAALPTTATYRCVDDWKPVGTRKDCFKLFKGSDEMKKTWFEARDYCRAIGGDLLSIHNDLELKLLHNGEAWIGLNEPNPGQGYEWSDGSPLNFQHWIEGEPNNMNNDESCTVMHMYKAKRRDGSWNDLPCEIYNNWLCQIRAGKTPLPPPNTTTDYNVTTDGWLEWKENQYYISKVQMPMDDARHYCQQKHGDLVVINSEAENLFLWKQISRTTSNYYIGVFVDLDGSFGWLDGSQAVFQKWSRNQPDFKNNDENCAVMAPNTGFWHDWNCGTEHKFICKRSVSPPVNTTVAPTVPPKGGCPLDWSKFNSKCYRIIQSRQDTWNEARSRCYGMGANLASILSRSEQVFLTIQMIESAAPDLWIGLNDLRGDGYQWTDGRSRRYMNWAYNTLQSRIHYPIYQFGMDASVFGSRYLRRHQFPFYMNKGPCVLMTSSSSLGVGNWLGKSCDDANGFVCQKNVDPQIQSPPELDPNTYLKVGNDSIKIITQNLTWDEAKKHCETDGAQLAAIENDGTQAYIELQALNLQAPLWIGLNKMETGGFFKFISGFHLNRENWAPLEPSSDRPCAYQDVDGKWKTSSCNTTMYSACMQTKDVPPTELTNFPGRCPQEKVINDWSPFPWQPFKGSCYAFITDEVEWPTAAINCRQHGGNLASIGDPSEQDFIKSKVKMLNDGHTAFWIGLFKSHNGNWLWHDNTIVDYTNWASGQQNFAHASYGEIAVENGKWRTGHRWHDRPYICKTVLLENPLPTSALVKEEARPRVHTSVVVIFVITIICVVAGIAFFLYKKFGPTLPSFEMVRMPQPDIVDTNKLIENADEENPEPIITQ